MDSTKSFVAEIEFCTEGDWDFDITAITTGFTNDKPMIKLTEADSSYFKLVYSQLEVFANDIRSFRISVLSSINQSFRLKEHKVSADKSDKLISDWFPTDVNDKFKVGRWENGNYEFQMKFLTIEEHFGDL